MSRVRVLLSCLSLLALLVSVAVVPATAVSADPVTYSRTITINAGKVPSAQTSFPLLISAADDTLKTVASGGHVANADGSDIYFTDPSGNTPYPSEIESYDGSTGSLVAWVKVPSLSDGTVLKMRYGGGSVAHSAADTWSNGFQAVWHMTSANATDSTANGNGMTAYGEATPPAIANTTGKIDGAQDFNPGGTYISRDANASLNFNPSGSYSWEAWVNWDGAQSGGSGIFGKKISPNQDGQGYVIYMGGTGRGGGWAGDNVTSQLRMSSSGGNTISVGAYNVGPAPGQWAHLAVTYSNHTVRMYINGQPIQVLTISAGGVSAPAFSGTLPTTGDDATPFIIGWRTTASASGSSNAHWNGALDELRYSGAERNADWILTEYNNQSNPGAFYTLSAEGVATTAPIVTTQPANQILAAGQTATFSAAASGTPAPTVQWQVSTNSGSSWDNVSGATETTLSFIAQAPDSGKQYHAVFTNSAGSATTNAATLTVTTGGGIWYVDSSGSGDFTTIQAAVNGASNGDTIVVKNGSYPENVTVNKSLTIQSQNGNSAVTVSPGSGPGGKVFTVAASNVVIDGFTIAQSGTASDYGIYLSGAYSNCTFKNNVINGITYGVFVEGSGAVNNIIDRNTIRPTTYGVYTHVSRYNTISNNTLDMGAYGAGASYGFYISDSGNNTVASNTLTDSKHLSSAIYDNGPNANYNTFRGNTIIGALYGVRLGMPDFHNDFYQNSFIGITGANVFINPGDDSGIGVGFDSLTSLAYWYNGAQLSGIMGNYWGSYYTGADGNNDGIGDAAYKPVPIYTDSYPLMYPFHSYVQSQVPTADFTANTQTVAAGISVTFSSLSSGSAPLSFAWSFGDGGTSTLQNPSHAYNASGTYTVSLTATNSLGNNIVARSNYITVAGNRTLYVDASGHGDFTTIQAAVDAAVEGDTIIVRDGTYFSAEINKSLILRSQNGPSAANITAGFAVLASGVTIDGFSITADDVGIYMWGPYSNCVFKNNVITGPIAGIEMKFYDTIYNNVADNNTIFCTHNNSWANRGVSLEYNQGSTVSNNTIYVPDGGGWDSWNNSQGVFVFNSGNNNIFNNKITARKHSLYTAGVLMEGMDSSNNQIHGNTFIDFAQGIHDHYMNSGNTFYQNSFIGAGTNIYCDCAPQVWNSSTPMAYWYGGSQRGGYLGNYWGSHYTGTDANGDGVGDTPYGTANGESDNYPLMYPYYNYVPAQAPVAVIDSDIQAGMAGFSVRFSSLLSIGSAPFTYSWNFGDGGTSTLQNPVHQYVVAGSYAVSLTVTNSYGSNTVTKDNYVTVAPPTATVPAFTSDVQQGSIPLAVQFTDQTTIGAPPFTYAWNFGDGGTSTEQSPSHTYTAIGTYTVSLTVTNLAGGNTLTKTDYITVTHQMAAFTSDFQRGHVPLTVAFSNQSQGSPISTYAWDFGDGATSAAPSPIHVYNATGTYTVSLTITYPGGSHTRTKTDYIKVVPVGPWTGFVDASGNGDFTTIQHAVDSVVDGDTVIVRNGTYPENVTVNKTLTIKSENRHGATVNPPSGSIFGVTASNVTIDGFTLTQGPKSLGAGISVASLCDNCTFINNAMTQVGYAIDMANASNNLIAHNDVYNLADQYNAQIAFHLSGSCNNNTLYGNYVSYNSWFRYYSVLLDHGATNNVVYENNFGGVAGNHDSSNVFHSPTQLSYSYNGTAYTSYLGNYWTTGYTGVDANGDGIGDTAYSNPGPYNGTMSDDYPLMFADPTADFAVNTLSGHPTTTTFSFSDRSFGSSPLTYAWSFGDGATSTEADPSHVYSTSGNFTVSLTVSNAIGSSTVTRTDYISVTASGVTQGDADGNGEVNVLDMVLAVNFALNKMTPTAAQLSAADCNGDGLVDIRDVVLIMNIILER